VSSTSRVDLAEPGSNDRDGATERPSGSERVTEAAPIGDQLICVTYQAFGLIA